jgi:LysM domain
MQGHQLIALTLSVALAAGCQSDRPMPPPAAPVASAPESTVEGTVVGDDRSAMEAAVDTGAGASSTPLPSETPGGMVMNPNAPDSYVVKRGDTLWGIAKVFLRDPWFWPEIWQVNPKIQNPHLIYPGDTLRLVYIEGRPTIMLQRGDAARVLPRVRSQPLEGAVTSIPYETVAAFMSKPSVLSREQIREAPYILATRDLHVAMADGDTVYARGFSAPVELGTHYNIVRVGDALRDPDDNRIVGYDGIFTGAGHVTRGGDPATLLMTESARETEAGDKLFAGGVDVPLDFIPSAPKTTTNGRIMSVSNGVTLIGQYEVVVINRGVIDGLAPGNILAVYQAGNVIADTANKGFLNGMSRLGAKHVRLPDERSGTFMVFKTFEHLSYGLIMEATDVIRVGDRVENP